MRYKPLGDISTILFQLFLNRNLAKSGDKGVFIVDSESYVAISW